MSGRHQSFEADYQKDLEKLTKLKANQPKRREHYRGLSPEQLESELLAVHQFHLQVRRLRAKYDSIWDSDEEMRKEIRTRNVL